ncbi:tRNA adenosine(34) deaminase TadA [Citricoccus sp. NR2]|uniref:tRNA adenosine(34) deaminase TadA n=1 Tax=Citricoccus sp. NR2 TaxID=3004095 RepID=UPI003FA48CF0
MSLLPVPDDTALRGWMQEAIELAENAGDRGDVPIGAVVVDAAGNIIGTGANEREQHGDPTAHAEVLALRRAAHHRAQQHPNQEHSWRLDDCTLIVTLEPCAMCAGAIVLARIPRLVFGAWDEKAGACGSVFDVVREPRLNHEVQVHPGVLESECAALLTDFFDERRRN